MNLPPEQTKKLPLSGSDLGISTSLELIGTVIKCVFIVLMFSALIREILCAIAQDHLIENSPLFYDILLNHPFKTRLHHPICRGDGQCHS